MLERGGDQLTVWESFKVFDGKIHAVEAFMRIVPVEKRNWGGPSVRPTDFEGGLSPSGRHKILSPSRHARL